MSKNDSLNGTTLPLRKIRQRESAVPNHRYYQVTEEPVRMNGYAPEYVPNPLFISRQKNHQIIGILPTGE